MIGVVLWSDASDRKAVIWCEDQGDLAFLNSAEGMFKSGAFFDAGDVVQFDMEVQASMRRAHNPRLVLEHARAGLPDALRQSVPDNLRPRPRPNTSAKIIPFEPRNPSFGCDLPRASEA